MSPSYYLASANYRPYLQPMPGLGSGARTTAAVLLGGPRAGAGSTIRIYNYLNTAGLLEAGLNNYRTLIRSRNYNYTSNSRNFTLGF